MGRLSELLVPGIVLVFGVVFHVETAGYPFESLVFPWFLMGILPVLAGLVLFTEHRRQASAAADRGTSASLLAELRAPAILLSACVGYLLVFRVTGFLVATVLFLALTMIALGARWPVAGIVAVAFSLSLYAVFGVLFEVPI